MNLLSRRLESLPSRLFECSPVFLVDIRVVWPQCLLETVCLMEVEPGSVLRELC